MTSAAAVNRPNVTVTLRFVRAIPGRIVGDSWVVTGIADAHEAARHLARYKDDGHDVSVNAEWSDGIWLGFARTGRGIVRIGWWHRPNVDW